MSSESDVFGLEVERALGAAAESPAPNSLRQRVLTEPETAPAEPGDHAPMDRPDRHH
jgi:hypothetical protein